MESYDSKSRLLNIVNRLKSQKNKYLLLKGCSIIAVLFLLTTGLTTILSLLASSAVYYAFLKMLCFIIFLSAVVKFIVLPIFSNANKNLFLGDLHQLSEGLGEDTLNAVELTNSENLGTSEELVLSHITTTTQRLESFDLTSLYPVRKLKRYLLTFLGAIVFAFLAIFLIPGTFPSYLFSLQLLPVSSGPNLQLANIEIKLKYPGYTQLEPKIIKGTSGDVKAIKGTEVQFEATPLSSFNEGSLLLDNGVSVPIKKADEKIKAGFTILSDGSYLISETSKGLRSESFEILAEFDHEPEVKISSPSGETIELGSEDIIEIFYEVEDDFNISKLILSLEGQRTESESPITIKEPRSNIIEGKITWGPSGINTQDSETIKLRVLAYDNDTISGPKIGISNPITVNLKDARSRHDEALNFTEQLMEELIDILGDELNLTFELKNLKDDSNKDVIDPKEIGNKQKKLTKKIEHATMTLDNTLSTMAEDEYSDYTFFVGLTNMDIRINNLLDQRKYLIESFAKIDMGRLENLMIKEIREFEDDVLLLDSMLKGDKLMDSLRSSNDLLNQYSELSELLNQLKEGDNSEIASQIEQKLNQIKQLMSQLAKKVNSISGDIQEGFLNQDAFEAANMQNQLDQILNLTKEGNIKEALEMLASMSENLQNMMASLENGMQSFGSSMMAKEMDKLNELVSRIENIEREETQIKDQTVDLKQSLLENPNTGTQNLREFIEKEMKKTEELIYSLKEARSKISGKSTPGSSPDGAYLVEKMIEKTQQLRNWLKAVDFSEAQKNAKSIQDSTQGLSEMSKLNYGNLGKATEEISEAAKLAKEIRRDLEGLSAKRDNQGQFAKMAGKQDEIQSETAKLTDELSELGSGFFVSPKLGEKLGQAEDYMGNASEDLRGDQVSKAISNQQEALKALRDAKEQAQDMLQQMQMSAKGNGSSAPMMLGQGQSGQGVQGQDSNRYVEIPKMDESQIGKEFKQQILEAMKGGSPEGYIELNKKYYDRIIK